MNIFDYGQIPPHMMNSLIRYITKRIRPGGFLEAVLNNDLERAVGCADSTNQQIIPVYIAYLTNHAPRGCWGYHSAVADWTRPDTDSE